jgi:hypothetical protein
MCAAKVNTLEKNEDYFIKLLNFFSFLTDKPSNNGKRGLAE